MKSVCLLLRTGLGFVVPICFDVNSRITRSSAGIDSWIYPSRPRHAYAYGCVYVSSPCPTSLCMTIASDPDFDLDIDTPIFTLKLEQTPRRRRLTPATGRRTTPMSDKRSFLQSGVVPPERGRGYSFVAYCGFGIGFGCIGVRNRTRQGQRKTSFSCYSRLRTSTPVPIPTTVKVGLGGTQATINLPRA